MEFHSLTEEIQILTRGSTNVAQFDLRFLPIEHIIDQYAGHYLIYLSRHPDYGAIVVKLETMYNKYHGVMHEAFIGLYGLNGWPNFAPVYGFNWNDHDHQPKNLHFARCNAVVYKYIEGPTLRQYIKGAYHETIATSTGSIYRSPDIMKEILMSLFLGLYHVWTHLQFTHYDAHLSNIIVTRLKNPMPLEYKDRLLGSTLFFPVMIDYDSAFVSLSNRDYGRTLPSGAVYKRGFWVHDVVKILANIYALTSYQYRRFALLELRNEQMEPDQKQEGLLTQWWKKLQSIVPSIKRRQIKQELERVESARRIADYEYRVAMEELEYNRPFNDPIADYVGKLLIFFFPEATPETLPQILRTYHDRYPYFETVATPDKLSLQFDDFLDYAVSIYLS